MNRTILLAKKVLPPFEVVEIPEFIVIKMKSDGDVFDVRIPIMKFEDLGEYVKYVREDLAAIQDSVVMAKAAEVRAV